MLITPNLVSRHKMVILFECCKKFQKSIVPIDFLLFSIVCKLQNNGISKNRQRNNDYDIFLRFLDFRRQNQYADQFSGPRDYFYRNYGPLFIEPILAKMTSFQPKMTSQRRRGKLVKSENCHANMVYGCIHEYKHQNSIQYIVSEKKQGGYNGPPHVWRSLKRPM